ncbi:iron chaperone [Microbacterium sp.]|uniref:iron chaperone n=1 Tax=Microbacterium sp. TaxID=51671 RepID=UPI003F70147B
MAAPETIDEYIAAQPPEVAERLRRIRTVVEAEVPDHEERIRYGMPAVMLGGRYALHFAGWKKHIGLYPVPTLDEPLEAEVAPYRSEKDSVVFPHARPVPYDLIGRITAAIVAKRGGA